MCELEDSCLSDLNLLQWKPCNTELDQTSLDDHHSRNRTDKALPLVGFSPVFGGFGHVYFPRACTGRYCPAAALSVQWAKVDIAIGSCGRGFQHSLETPKGQTTGT